MNPSCAFHSAPKGSLEGTWKIRSLTPKMYTMNVHQEMPHELPEITETVVGRYTLAGYLDAQPHVPPGPPLRMCCLHREEDPKGLCENKSDHFPWILILLVALIYLHLSQSITSVILEIFQVRRAVSQTSPLVSAWEIGGQSNTKGKERPFSSCIFLALSPVKANSCFHTGTFSSCVWKPDVGDGLFYNLCILLLSSEPRESF